MKLIKIPLNAGNIKHKKGLEKGPDAVEKELKNFYLKENKILPFIQVDEIKVDNSDIDESNKIIEKAVSEIDNPTILLGGDHSMTYSSFKGMSALFVNEKWSAYETSFVPM